MSLKIYFLNGVDFGKTVNDALGFDVEREVICLEVNGSRLAKSDESEQNKNGCQDENVISMSCRH